MTDTLLHWQDQELKFDVGLAQLKLGPGEKMFTQSDQIEDSKGNPGNFGVMQITNLRSVWYQVPDSKINLSLGYDCLLSMEYKFDQSKSGIFQMIHIKAKQKNSRFEFIFQTQAEDGKNFFNILKSSFQSYQQTKLYREIKARGAITENKNLILFDQEKVISNYNNIMSISSDNSSVIGKLFLTNVRLAWFAMQNESFNISIPWICIKTIRKKDLKTGPSIIIETKSLAGGYIVGYKGNDIEKITIDAQKIHQVYTLNPILGVEPNQIDIQQQKVQEPQFNEDIEIIDTGYVQKLFITFSRYNEISTSSKSYNIGGEDNDPYQTPIIFTSQLGLAIEKPPDGVTIEDLWKIINLK